MMKDKREKILKTLISFIITFLVIFITVVVLRALTLNINAGNNKAHAFLKDYFDVMHNKTELIASKLKIKSDNVSEYQRNLISQSVNDYASLLKYQTFEISKDFNPNQKLSPAAIDRYKEAFYKMILENPYIMSITFFGDGGQMKLNLFSVKGITIELSEQLREKARLQGSVFVHADNENALYTIMYIQNEYGSYYVATRNDYMFVSDMIAYYQIPESSFMITDSYNVTQRIEQNDIALMSERAKENISSIIGRYAYYRQEPAFSIDAQSSLMVSMVSRNYPNYFELILISFTALMIVIAQRVIVLLISLFKKTFPMGFARKEDVEDKKAASIINKSMVQDDSQLAYEGLSLENVLQYNENMRNDNDDFYAEKSSTANNVGTVERENVVPFFGVGSIDLDEESLGEIDEGVSSNNDNVGTHHDSIENNAYSMNSTNNNEVYQEEMLEQGVDVGDSSDETQSVGEYEYGSTTLESSDSVGSASSDKSYGENIEQSQQEEASHLASNVDIVDISKKEVKRYNNRSVDDIFASFDNLLESIISKADQNNVGSDEKE